MDLTNMTRYPFIDGLTNRPEHKKKDMLKIKAWMNTQPHLPRIPDDYIYLFLHACCYSQDKTKSAIENYFTIRANTPSIFSNKDLYSERLQNVLSLGHLARLPKLTPEGYRVLMYAVRDPDPTKLNFVDAVKGFCMYNDCVLSEDSLVEGYVILFDMKGVAIGHLARVSLPALKAFMFYIQEAHPARLKAIHVLNTASWIHHIMRIILPLIKSDLLSIVKFHKENAPEGFPREILPMDYGGEAPSVQELDEATKALVDKYAEWLKESEVFKADESKRLVKKSSWWGLFNSNNNTNNTKVDEKVIIQNLQID